MKEEELRKWAVCANCGNKIGHTGLPLFWRVTIERFGIDLEAVQQQTGLAMMLGGSARLAQVMGPDRDMASPVMEPLQVALCEECAPGQVCIAALAEKAAKAAGPTE